MESDQLRTLYEQHAAALHRLLVRLLSDPQAADDVRQIVFAKLAEQDLNGIESVTAWLFRVAFNEAMTWQRRRAIDQKSLEKLIPPPASAGGDEIAKRNEQVDAVRRAIATLSPEQRAVVRLRIYEQQKFADIAEQLGIPLGTALGRMRSALQKLESELLPHGPRE